MYTFIPLFIDKVLNKALIGIQCIILLNYVTVGFDERSTVVLAGYCYTLVQNIRCHVGVCVYARAHTLYYATCRVLFPPIYIIVSHRRYYFNETSSVVICLFLVRSTAQSAYTLDVPKQPS